MRHIRSSALISMFMLTALVLGTVSAALAQVSIPAVNTPVAENFNSLASAGTSSAVPAGWAFLEAGTSANLVYTAGTGSLATGDTYSFGATGNAERAFGGLQSGTLIPTIGGSFQNNTGSTINALRIAYTGEQWRLGAMARTDRLDFQYSLDATSLTTGTWTDVNALDFTAPITGGTVGLLDGNLAGNRTALSSTICGLSLAPNAIIWIRWTDFNPAGSDDGLAVDDFSIEAPSQATTTTLVGPPAASCGDKVTLVATVVPNPGGGIVEFYDGATLVATATVDANGVAVGSIPNIPFGSKSITAVFTGTCGFAASTSNKVQFNVFLTPTATVLAPPVKSFCGDKVTLTATVTPVMASGQVNFFDGATPIGSGTLVNGVATLSILTLAVGHHSITATYKGDACYLPSTSNKIDQEVNPLATTTTLSSDPNPSTCGQKVTLTARVAPAAATGEVNFFDAGTPIGSGTLVNGEATLSITTLAVGTHSITAVYKGEACYGASTSNKIDQEVRPVLTTTTLASDPNPSTCGAKVTFTAVVSPTDATGEVNFFDGGAPIGHGALVNGVATLSIATLAVGFHSITAVYKGDACHATSSSNKIEQEVRPALTTTTLASDPNPSTCGAKVTFTAVVSPTDATGEVNFFDGGVPFGHGALVNGVATLSIATLAVGIHSITAVYKGDACHATSSSNKIEQEVRPALTTTTLASDPNPSTCGQKVTLTARVAPAAATGEVNFFDAGTPIGSGTLVNGEATLSIATLAVGIHSITAVYKGDACHATSSSNKIDQEVRPTTTTTTLASDPNPSDCGQKVTLTARVAPAAATGQVNFFDAGTPIGSATLVNGEATLSITTLAVGTHSITAVYKGDACYAGSTSNKVEQLVRRSITTTTLVSDDLKSECGSKVTLTATVAPATANGVVSFIEGSTVIGSVPLVNGVAVLSISTLAVGTHSIFALYNGDDCHGFSASNPIQQVVNPAATTLALTSDPSPSTCREDKVTVTATVSPGSATGTVNFFDAGVPIGSAPLVNGVATLSVTTFMNGTHPLTAVYKGDDCHATSTGSHEHVRDCPVATLLTLFQAEPRSGAVELRWQYGDPGQFVETRIDRAMDPAGPWTTANVERRQEGSVMLAVDRSVTPGNRYWYRLVGIPQAGAPAVFGPLEATAGSSVQSFELASIWPNPTQGQTRIDFAVAKQSSIRLSIVDVQGREIAVLAEGSHRPGRYQAVWTGEMAGRMAPVGLYFIRYQVPGKVMTGRIALTR